MSLTNKLWDYAKYISLAGVAALSISCGSSAEEEGECKPGRVWYDGKCVEQCVNDSECNDLVCGDYNEFKVCMEEVSVCGDGECENPENENTCPEDCFVEKDIIEDLGTDVQSDNDLVTSDNSKPEDVLDVLDVNCEKYGNWYELIDGKCCMEGSEESLICVIDSFNSPGDSPTGLAWDGQYLWNANSSENPDKQKIYQLTNTGEIINSFTAPGGGPSGLAWDGQFMWNVSYFDDKVYKLTTDGQVIGDIDTPDPENIAPSGLTWDGNNFWITGINNDIDQNTVYKVSKTGNVLDSFNLKKAESSKKINWGLAWDGEYLWTCRWDDYTKKIEKIDFNGENIESFQSPAESPRGLLWAEDHLWHSDFKNGVIYKLEIVKQ